MPNNVYLVGLMGSGKTTTGRHLASFLQYQFVDTDQALEKRTGVSIQHIFEIEGEACFRNREAKVLVDICENSKDAYRGTVVSTGGGIVLCKSNRLVMRESGTIIYLRATLEALWHRLQSNRTRPLLNGPDPKNTIAQLLAERELLYSTDADYIVDICSESSANTARKIHTLLTDEKT